MFSHKMHNMRYISCLILCILLFVTVQGFDCPYQECYCAGPEINCDDRDLNTIPHLIAEQNTFFTVLVLDSNLISTVQNHSLPANLTEISFTSNPITNIARTAFDESASTLEYLSFSDANFDKISDAFLQLKALKNLNILNSRIQDWNLGAMKNIGKTLQTLSLENVGFTTWPTWIQYFFKLTEISITGSSISSLPDDAMDQLSNTLSSLSLNNNSLTEVPKTLSKLSALQMLSLEQNKIVNVTWLPQSSKLMFLSLSHNNIPDGGQLSSVLYQYANSMNDLGLSDNKLNLIPSLSFLTLVGSLNLTRNLISDSNSGSLPPALYELDLGSNSLTEIPRVMLALNSVTALILPSNAITEIRDVDIPPWTTATELGFNLITELTDTSFPQDSEIQFLRLHNNPLIKISTQAFINLPRLVELDLQYTKLTRLPLALASLQGIVTLDLFGTKDLVCTCLEKSLETWILSQSSENIIGNCGQMSVYNFFVTLSPHCPQYLNVF